MFNCSVLALSWTGSFAVIVSSEHWTLIYWDRLKLDLAQDKLLRHLGIKSCGAVLFMFCQAFNDSFTTVTIQLNAANYMADMVS